MKIEIEETSKKKKIVDTTLPYFYRHVIDLDDCEVIIFGKIEEGKHTAISEKEKSGGFEYELEVEKIKNFIDLSAYFSDEYRSNEEEFASAKTRLLSASNNA